MVSGLRRNDEYVTDPQIDWQYSKSGIVNHFAAAWPGSNSRGRFARVVMRMRSRKIDYTLRESHRAKRVLLKVGVNGLEIVVPKRFGKRRLPGILEANREWIERELQKVKESPSLVAPECIDLSAIDERWQVNYQSPPTSDGRFSVEETASGRLLVDGRFSVKENASNRLLVRGDVNDVRGVSSVLTQWLHLKAHAHLVPWLREVSQEVDLPFKKATVRGQTTRWASCSKSGNISINRNLLFLPEHLVRHVFLHELCHVKELNHSADFWRLLSSFEGDCKSLEAEVRKANRYVPPWVSLR